MSNDTRRQIFIFNLDDEDYSIDIDNVREIIKSEEKEITKVPNVPDFITGITNVRGQVVPVIDLEEKLSLSHKENDYIVIVELNGTPAGLLVDDVKEVMRVEEDKIRDAPEILEQEIHREYVKDVVVLEDRMIIILDIKAGLSESETVAVEELRETMDNGSNEEDEDDEVTHQDVKNAAMNRLDDSEEEEEGQEADDENDESSEDNEEKEFECDECGEQFDSKRDLASHKVQEH